MPTTSIPVSTPIAIVGASALLPGPAGADGFWRTVFFGDDQVTDVPETHWLVDDYYDPDPAAPDKSYTYRGGFLSPIQFDPLHFGIPPATLPAIDTSQLLAMVAAEQLLSVMDTPGSTVDHERTSVILGISGLEMLATMGARMQRPVWLKALRESGVPEPQAQSICDRIAAHYVPWQESSLPGMLTNVVAGRVANRFDLHGTNYTTDAACASSLAAVSSAANQLALGQADLVITGGIDTLNDPLIYTSFSKTPALSPSGDCRPFSTDADGMVLGEGVVLFALRRLADAERDGNRILAVIRGIGAASDGRGGAIYAPQSSGQARALRRAYETAGYGPDTVELIEAHGTGTAAGDAAETAALREVFDATGRGDPGWCALGSVKSQIGHTKSAAGAAGLLKAALAVYHGVLPPTIKVDRPNPKLGLDGSPFYVNTHARPWISNGAHPRRAGVSSFGFGGTNFHVAVEEHVPASAVAPVKPRTRTVDSELVLLSAESPGALQAAARRLADGPEPLAEVARRSQETFDHAAPVRLGVVATGEADLAAKLRAATDRIAADPATSFAGSGGVYGATAADPGPVAFLFSGQGSQYVGMGAELAMLLPEALASWDSVAAMPCSTVDGEPLHRVVFPPPAFTDHERAEQRDRLTRTEWAQPALAAQSLAALELLRVLGVRPDAVGGHSFGELVALQVAGCYDPETLLRLARRRGELMRDASAVPGAMVAVFGSPDEVSALVTAVDKDDLWVANHNAPRQVVVAGTTVAVERLERHATGNGYTVRRLSTATGFHSPLVAAAAEPFRRALDAEIVKAPSIPVYRNTTAAPYPDDAEAVRAGLAEQLAAPVRFTEQIEAMYATGIRTFIEVGANATLTRFTGEILADREHLAVSLDRRRAGGVAALQDALARLAVGGVRLDFAALWRPYPPGMKEDTVKSQASGSTAAVELLGTNYGKPYPPPGGGAALPPPNPSLAPNSPGELAPLPAPAGMPAVTPATTVPAVPVPAVPMSNGHGPEPSWLATVSDTQRLASEAHATYQRVMAETHLAFLRMSEAALTRLGDDSLTGATDTPALARPEATSALPAASLPVSPPPPMPVAELVPVAAPISVQAIPEPRPTLEPMPAPSSVSMGVTLDVVMAAVANKTGYPIDVLNPTMDLETDLGIDSIKRVEILSTIREQVTVPDLDPAKLAAARTLQEVTDILGSTTATDVNSTTSTPVPDPEPTSAAPPLRFATRHVAAPPCGLALPGLADGPVALIGGPAQLANSLAATLAARGVDAHTATEVSASATNVIYLGGLEHPVKNADEANREAFSVAKAFAQVRGDEPGVFAVIQDSGRTPDRAWPTGLTALARTAAREWPEITVKTIDCDTAGLDDEVGADVTAGMIATELLMGGSSPEVALSAAAGRTVPEIVELTAQPAGASRVGPHSVLVVSGGARGITAAAVLALAEKHTPKALLLLGRTPLADEPAHLRDAIDEAAVRQAVIDHLRATGQAPEPRRIRTETTAALTSREVRDTVRALEASGSAVRYLPVDITDGDAVRAALAKFRAEWGPVTGLIHGAGVLADKTIRDKTAEQFDHVFDTKVNGLRSLLAATEDDPLELLCVFSSIAASVGNAGQSDYAMANEVATRLADAQRHRRPDCLVRTIAWGPWSGGMVDGSLAAHFRADGISLIELASGAQAFVDELRDDRRDGTNPGTDTVIRSAGPPPPRDGVSGELVLSAHDHPYLADHAIVGVPVVPVALALEWFTAVAVASLPGEQVVITDLEVLSKIALDDFASAGHRLRLTTDRPDPAGPFTIRLTGQGGRPHYRATFAVADNAPGARRWTAPTGLPGMDVIYDGHLLFHGPAFHALADVEGLGAAGGIGTLRGIGELGWPDGLRHTDPAAVDGCIQLASGWAAHVLGVRATLPMGVGAFRIFAPGPLTGPATAIVRPGKVGDSEARCSIQASDPDGRPLFELIDVRQVSRPDAPRNSPER